MALVCDEIYSTMQKAWERASGMSFDQSESCYHMDGDISLSLRLLRTPQPGGGVFNVNGDMDTHGNYRSGWLYRDCTEWHTVKAPAFTLCLIINSITELVIR